MFKITIVIAAAALLAACSTSRMAALSQYQVDYSPWATAESVSAVAFERKGRAGNLPLCVAAVVSNTGETLSDSSNSFFGAYSGNYYNIQKSVQAAGGDVLQFVSSDASSLVATGSVRYEASALVHRSVRFKLVAQQDESGRNYRFSDLAQAQINTGAAANTGYGPIGSWAGANPDLALGALGRVADEIERCLASN